MGGSLPIGQCMCNYKYQFTIKDNHDILVNGYHKYKIEDHGPFKFKINPLNSSEHPFSIQNRESCLLFYFFIF